MQMSSYQPRCIVVLLPRHRVSGDLRCVVCLRVDWCKGQLPRTRCNACRLRSSEHTGGYCACAAKAQQLHILGRAALLSGMAALGLWCWVVALAVGCDKQCSANCCYSCRRYDLLSPAFAVKELLCSSRQGCSVGARVVTGPVVHM